MTIPTETPTSSDEDPQRSNINTLVRTDGAIIPTKEGARAANAGEYAPGKFRSLVEALARRWARPVRIGTAVGIGVTGGYAVYDNVPTIQRAIDQSYHNVLQMLKLEAVIIPREVQFPNKLDQASFTSIGSTEATRITQKVDLEHYKGSIEFPIDQGTIDNSPNLRFNSFFDATLSPFTDKAELEKLGIKNVWQIDGLEKDPKTGKIIVRSPVEGSAILLYEAGVKEGEGIYSYTPPYTAIRFMFRDNRGREYSLTLSAKAGKLLTDISTFSSKYSPITGDGKKVAMFEPILELGDESTIKDAGKPIPGEAGQVTMRLLYDQLEPRDLIPLDLNFLKSPNGEIIVLDPSR